MVDGTRQRKDAGNGTYLCLERITLRIRIRRSILDVDGVEEEFNFIPTENLGRVLIVRSDGTDSKLSNSKNWWRS